MTNSVDPDNSTFLLKKHPEVVLRQQTDLMEFLANTHNIVPREDFYVYWSVFLYLKVDYFIDIYLFLLLLNKLRCNTHF